MKLILLLTALLIGSFWSQAQNKREDKGYLIYTLGKDTTFYGHYRLQGNQFAITAKDRNSRNVMKQKGQFFPNGELQYVEGYHYKPAPAEKDSQLVQTLRMYHKGDSTYIESKTGNQITSSRYPVKTMVVTDFWPYIFMPPLLANYAPKQVGDSVVSTHIVLGSARNFVLKRISKNKITAGSGVMGTFILNVNENNHVVSIDAIGTSYNLLGKVVSYLNIDSLILADARREQNLGRTITRGNKKDSVQTTINSTAIKISYSRPSMKGRAIFGQVVPWNRAWRTGANWATKLTLSQPIYFDGKELPAGTYSIFTLPSLSGWTMMFNKEATIWGTDYNPAHDVLRVPIQVEQLKEPVELMTLEVVPKDKGGAINIIWEKTKASAHFTTKH